MKWDMGWMHDTFAYFRRTSIGRRYHHHKLTFRSMYF
jgi:1,4-alpha-glucan branching enzyme